MIPDITTFMKKLHFSNFSFSHTIPPVCVCMLHVPLCIMLPWLSYNVQETYFLYFYFLLSFCVIFFFCYSATCDEVKYFKLYQNSGQKEFFLLLVKHPRFYVQNVWSSSWMGAKCNDLSFSKHNKFMEAFFSDDIKNIECTSICTIQKYVRMEICLSDCTVS